MHCFGAMAAAPTELRRFNVKGNPPMLCGVGPRQGCHHLCLLDGALSAPDRPKREAPLNALLKHFPPFMLTGNSPLTEDNLLLHIPENIIMILNVIKGLSGKSGH